MLALIYCFIHKLNIFYLSSISNTFCQIPLTFLSHFYSLGCCSSLIFSCKHILWVPCIFVFISDMVFAFFFLFLSCVYFSSISLPFLSTFSFVFEFLIIRRKLCFSPLLSVFLRPDVCGLFSHQAILQFSTDTNWVSYKFNSVLIISTRR